MHGVEKYSLVLCGGNGKAGAVYSKITYLVDLVISPQFLLDKLEGLMAVFGFIHDIRSADIQYDPGDPVWVEGDDPERAVNPEREDLPGA